jgi:3-dehydroquinate dehydratase/shikimate dehydrogenase
MGKDASFGRVLGPWMGNYFDYAYLDGSVSQALGQLSVDELLSVYRYRNIGANTLLYGLFGYPIDGSIGHYFHNDQFEKLKKNAIYLKIPIQEEELVESLSLALRLNFQGLSITMPLKQKLASLMGQKLTSVNTLKQVKKVWTAFNVDGIGALEAFEQEHQGKVESVLIIGNGGAAQAIVEAFRQKNYRVDVLARHPRPGEYQKISDLDSKNYQAIINTIPAHAYEIDGAWIQEVLYLLRPGLMVMDIVYHEVSRFSSHAQLQKCHVISGLKMYHAQALHQLHIWLDT